MKALKTATSLWQTYGLTEFGPLSSSLRETQSKRTVIAILRNKNHYPPFMHFVMLYARRTDGLDYVANKWQKKDELYVPPPKSGFLAVAGITCNLSIMLTIKLTFINSRMLCCKRLLSHSREHSSNIPILHVCERGEKRGRGSAKGKRLPAPGSRGQRFLRASTDAERPLFPLRYPTMVVIQSKSLLKNSLRFAIEDVRGFRVTRSHRAIRGYRPFGEKATLLWDYVTYSRSQRHSLVSTSGGLNSESHFDRARRRTGTSPIRTGGSRDSP